MNGTNINGTSATLTSGLTAATGTFTSQLTTPILNATNTINGGSATLTSGLTAATLRATNGNTSVNIGNVEGQYACPVIDLCGDARNGGASILNFKTSAGVLRHGIGLSSAEPSPNPTNSGANLEVWRYDNSGTLLGSFMTFERLTGRVTIADLNVTNSIAAPSLSLTNLSNPTSIQTFLNTQYTTTNAIFNTETRIGLFSRPNNFIQSVSVQMEINIIGGSENSTFGYEDGGIRVRDVNGTIIATLIIGNNRAFNGTFNITQQFTVSVSDSQFPLTINGYVANFFTLYAGFVCNFKFTYNYESNECPMYYNPTTNKVSYNTPTYGQVVNEVVWDYKDLGLTDSATSTLFISKSGSSPAQGILFSCTYTPKLTSSYLYITVTAPYQFIGTGSDFITVSMIVAGANVCWSFQGVNQVWNPPGTGNILGRSAALFPLSGRYTNTSITTKTISILADTGQTDDTLQLIYKLFGTPSLLVNIREIAR